MDPLAETTNANLKLEPAWTLSGRVTDTNAAPITNAQAQLTFRGGAGAAPMGPPLAVDTQGRFAFKALPPGVSFRGEHLRPRLRARANPGGRS